MIATGSTATVPSVSGLAEAGYLTQIEALALQRRLESLIVIGAGPLGLEFGQMYARFGTRVTILQRGPLVFLRTEARLAQRLAEILQSERRRSMWVNGAAAESASSRLSRAM